MTQQRHKKGRIAVTLDDVAREVSMSRTTVSRALNGHSDVSEKTRRVIEKAARELGYHAHAVARRLATGRSFAVGAITAKLPFIRDALFVEVIDVLRAQLARADYELVLGSRDPGIAGVDDAVSLIRHRRIDGIVLLETELNDSFLSRIAEFDIPLVLFGRSPEYPDLPYVDTDGGGAIETVAEYLVGLGHRRIGYIGGPPRAVCSVHRLEGYRRVMKTYGFPHDDLYLEVNPSDLAAGYAAARSLLSRNPAPTALVCYCDAVAHGAMRAAHELGLKLPDELSVVGFDNVALNDFITPQLTSVAQRTRDIGMHLARLILAAIQGEPTEPKQVLLGTELIVRESCKPPPATEFL